MLHGRGLCGSQGVQAFTPALLLTRAWMGSSYISHSQMHVHLTELEAEICHRANSCPMRESIINLTINLANSSWISQEFLQAIAYNRSPTATAHNLSYHLLLLFVPEQHARHHHLSLHIGSVSPLLGPCGELNPKGVVFARLGSIKCHCCHSQWRGLGEPGAAELSFERSPLAETTLQRRPPAERRAG